MKRYLFKSIPLIISFLTGCGSEDPGQNSSLQAVADILSEPPSMWIQSLCGPITSFTPAMSDENRLDNVYWITGREPRNYTSFLYGPANVACKAQVSLSQELNPLEEQEFPAEGTLTVTVFIQVDDVGEGKSIGAMQYVSDPQFIRKYQSTQIHRLKINPTNPKDDIGRIFQLGYISLNP